MKTLVRHLLLLLSGIILFVLDGYSRAGGGGGHHSSSGGHSSGSFHSSGFSGTGGGGGSMGIVGILIILFVVVVIFVILFSVMRKKVQSALGEGTSDFPPVDLTVLGPEFNEELFMNKVRVAFPAIQDAWMNKNLSQVRRWITDGVYQRFNAQFIMMRLLEQDNKLSRIRINGMNLVEAEAQGKYFAVTVAIQFTMDDEFRSKNHPEFDERFSGDTATEYWTFIRKAGVPEKDLYLTNSCPGCGHELNKDGGEVSKCPSCGSITYLGDYDWVLCEITQEEDFAPKSVTAGILALHVQPLYDNTQENFSIQLMEDKASNAIMQYFASVATKDVKYLRRFMSDELMARIEEQAKQQTGIVFNRLFLNKVDLSAYAQTEGRHQLTFDISYSAMRLAESKSGLVKLDEEAEKSDVTLILSKKVGAVAKNKLWSFECASCGAPYSDTTDTTCSYCSAKINSADTDWVVTTLEPLGR
jgi:predicted lipid-binding transport protein (Tim44 family)